MSKKHFTLALVTLFAVYFLTHLIGLVSLPVFADESIYIRWSQLIIDDWQRYLFFPLNDGKTPLFIWLLVPLQKVFYDPLFAGRLLSVLVGALQIGVVIKILQELGTKKGTQILGGVAIVFLPFWYFHHRMALMDGLLTLFISITFLFLLKAVKMSKKAKQEVGLSKVITKKNIYYLVLAGFSFTLALLTKIPAVLFIPAFYFTIFFAEKKQLLFNFLRVSFSLAIGAFFFLLLKLNPAFGQLFSRGGDFLFPLNEVLDGAWKETLASVPNYIGYFLFYLTPTVLIVTLIGLFMKKNKQIVHTLFWSAVFFIAPIALMGKTVYPRYLFPASLFLTLAFIVSLEGLLDYLLQRKLVLYKKILGSMFLAVFLANTFSASLNYVFISITNPNSTPFVSADRVQYLTEWSSGHGIKETFELIKEKSEHTKLAVATEGYFGTLPDALLMYLHNQDVNNLYLEGIGYPVDEVPDFFVDKANEFETKWLVVNSHRMLIDLDEKYLVAEFARPFNAPTLQVWDITDLLKK